MARPTIGDFRSTENNKPRTSPAQTPTVATPPPNTAVSDNSEEKDVEVELTPDEEKVKQALTDDSDFLSPAEKYRENLKKMKIELKEAEAIYDGVLSKGYYEEYIRIRGNNRAVFRTRTYEDHLRLQTILEMQKPQLAISQDDLITRYNLAASLYEWNGKQLKHDTDDDFDTVMRMIRKLPGPLFTVLARELSKFDAKIMTVFSEGAAENF
jgi:hypothetical protein